MTDFAAAEAGIRELHQRYTDAVWRQDFEAFAQCFAEDGEWRISGMALKGRPQIKETIAAILARFPGAKIIDVRIPDAPEAETAEADLPVEPPADDDET